MNALLRPFRKRGYLVALIATAVWSWSAIFISYLTTRFGLPPLVLVFWRNLIVTVTLFCAITVLARPLLRVGRQHILFFVLYALVLVALNWLFTVSVERNGAALSTVLVYSSPAFTVLIESIRERRRPSPLKIGAVLLSFVGCVFVSGAYERTTWNLNPLGIAAGLLGGLAFAVYGLFGKASSRRGVNPWTTILYSFAFSTVFLALGQRTDTIFWLSRPPTGGPRGSSEAAMGWGALALLALGPTIGGYGLYMSSLVTLPAVTANLIVTLEPVLTAVIAFFLLGERLVLEQLLGAGLILTGVALLYLSDRATAVFHSDGRCGKCHVESSLVSRR